MDEARDHRLELITAVVAPGETGEVAPGVIGPSLHRGYGRGFLTTAPVHPACAGNRGRRARSPARPSVHPACAGNRVPPSAWPRPPAVHPACAGNSIADVSTSPYRSVHPRVCGEQSNGLHGSRNESGSSPRVRGTDTSISCCARARRFIPACAGNRRTTAACASCRTVHPRVCGEQPTTAGSR